MIKNIIFDYGAVIFAIDHQLTINAIIALDVKKDADFFGHLKQNPLFDDFERGEISPEIFRNRIRKLSESNLTDTQIDMAWNKMLIGIPDGNLEALLSAKKKYRTFLLSNNNAIHYQWILNYLNNKFQLKDGMESFFEKDYYSHLLGMRKPDAAIFEYVLVSNQLIPNETLFIDDSPQHINTAIKLGLHTHLMLETDNLADIIHNI